VVFDNPLFRFQLFLILPPKPLTTPLWGTKGKKVDDFRTVPIFVVKAKKKTGEKVVLCVDVLCFWRAGCPCPPPLSFLPSPSNAPPSLFLYDDSKENIIIKLLLCSMPGNISGFCVWLVCSFCGVEFAELFLSSPL
jgi:hypothetical protein